MQWGEGLGLASVTYLKQIRQYKGCSQSFHYAMSYAVLSIWALWEKLIMLERLSGKKLWEDCSQESALNPMSPEELKAADNCATENRLFSIQASNG